MTACTELPKLNFSLSLSPSLLHSQVLMIGDDLVNDVGGAQCCGMKGVQVRTGKYRSVTSCIPTEPEHDTPATVVKQVSLMVSLTSMCPAAYQA